MIHFAVEVWSWKLCQIKGFIGVWRRDLQLIRKMKTNHCGPPLVLMWISEEKMNPGNYTLQHVTKTIKIENNQNKNISQEKKLKNV